MARRHRRGRGKSKMCNLNYQGEPMSYYRTPEHRKLRADLIRRWRPWENSTGPKTEEGKARSAMRGFKGNERALLLELRRLLREQESLLKEL